MRFRIEFSAEGSTGPMGTAVQDSLRCRSKTDFAGRRVIMDLSPTYVCRLDHDGVLQEAGSAQYPFAPRHQAVLGFDAQRAVIAHLPQGTDKRLPSLRIVAIPHRAEQQ